MGGHLARGFPPFARATRTLNRWMALAASTVSAGIMLGIVADVVNRQLTGRSLPGMIELVETFMVIVVYLGIAHAEAVGAHVRMSLVTNVLPATAKAVARSISLLAGIVACGWFAWATAQRAIMATAAQEFRPGLLRFPLWPARIIIAVGFALLTVEYALRLWELWRGEDPIADPDRTRHLSPPDATGGGD